MKGPLRCSERGSKDRLHFRKEKLHKLSTKLRQKKFNISAMCVKETYAMNTLNKDGFVTVLQRSKLCSMEIHLALLAN